MTEGINRLKFPSQSNVTHQSNPNADGTPTTAQSESQQPYNWQQQSEQLLQLHTQLQQQRRKQQTEQDKATSKDEPPTNLPTKVDINNRW